MSYHPITQPAIDTSNATISDTNVLQDVQQMLLNLDLSKKTFQFVNMPTSQATSQAKAQATLAQIRSPLQTGLKRE